MSAIVDAESQQGMARTLAHFRAGKARSELDVATTASLSLQAAEGFLAHYHASGGYLAEAIALLCEIATLESPELAAPGVRGLFSFLVERLSDSFHPRYCVLYDRLFAQVVSFCRTLPAGQALDGALARFGLHTPEDLLQRKERLKAGRPFPPHGREAVHKVLIPSRVTVGADIAITSVVMAGAKALLPHAEIVLLALPSTEQLFRGDRRVRIRPVSYNRSGDLIGRLNAWLDVLAAVDAEITGLEAGEYLALDPDSRLTQLGIFPLLEDERRYRFFESRGYRKPGLERISDLTAAWLAECFGEPVEARPYLSLAAEDVQAGETLCGRLRRGGAKHIVAVNLGVGGNERKRAGEAFEQALLLELLAAGSAVILAKGVGAEEVARAERLAAAVASRDWRVVEVDPAKGEPIGADLATWQGDLGAYCGLIGAADLYVGYDSAGQHIAAALGVPTIDIFVDHSYPLIARRWRPCGASPVEAVEASAGSTTEELLAQVLAAYRRMRTWTSAHEARYSAGKKGQNHAYRR